MDTKQIVKRVEGLLEPILRGEGLELVEVEFRRERAGWVLRVYIDKKGGVTLGDCVRVSRELGEVLDVEDFIPYSYHLEVSSPGINRPLRKPKDFERFKGEWVKLKLSEPLEGRRNIRGQILGCEGDKLFLLSEGRVFEVSFEKVSKANLDPKVEV